MNDKKKRIRRPKLKDGELRVYLGRPSRREAPDVCFAWQGCPTMRPDSRLIYNCIASRRPDPSVTPIFSKMLPSLIEELELRGYDITTIKFSIMKKELL